MYYTSVCLCRIEKIKEALCDTRLSRSSESELCPKVAGQIGAWHNQSITCDRAYVLRDGIWLKRSWAGDVKNVAVLMAICVIRDGFRAALGVAECTKEDKASWQNFLH